MVLYLPFASFWSFGLLISLGSWESIYTSPKLSTTYVFIKFCLRTSEVLSTIIQHEMVL